MNHSIVCGYVTKKNSHLVIIAEYKKMREMAECREQRRRDGHMHPLSLCIVTLDSISLEWIITLKNIIGL